MNQTAAAYFRSINPLTRKIVNNSELVQGLFCEKWESFGEHRQDEILDDYFVRPEIREKYKSYEKTDTYPNSYPVLKIQMGEKIVVDETNDFWTWQDEFSGPFSWKSKSQQDLTLLDLEPEQMTKQSKTRRRNSRDFPEEETRKTKEFPVQEPGTSLWNSEFKELQNNEFTRPQNTNNTQIHVISHTNGTVQMDTSPEEINYAFNRDSFIETYDQRKSDRKDVKDLSNTNIKKNSATDMALNGTASKRRHDIEMSVFENPMVFQVVEDEESLSSATTSPSHRPLLKGHNSTNMSPSRNPLLKEDSQESTTSGKSQLYEPSSFTIERNDTVSISDKSRLVSAVDYEDTELIAVDVDPVELNETCGSMGSSNLPKTGFDFLDQW